MAFSYEEPAVADTRLIKTSEVLSMDVFFQFLSQFFDTFLNETLWITMLLANFGIIMLIYKFTGRLGLFVWIPIATIIANLQVVKTVEIFGLTTTLGNIVYASTFLVTDILSEKYGSKSARKGVYIGFFSILSMVVLLQLALVFRPVQGDWELLVHDSMGVVFGLVPRIALASVIAYALSQLHDVWAYANWKKAYEGKPYSETKSIVSTIFFRNNMSTLISQLIDSLIFCTIAFLGVFEWNIFFEILLTTYLMKVLVALADTPFIYWATKMKVPRFVELDEE
jgi:uncharacterized integral membrane protein (TIGR00697 family)